MIFHKGNIDTINKITDYISFFKIIFIIIIIILLLIKIL